MEPKKGDTTRGFLLTAFLSLLFAPILIVGPFIAGFMGGRKVRNVAAAIGIAILPALVWAGFWIWISGHEWKIGSQKITPTPLSMLGPATALAILGGALTGTKERFARVTGAMAGIAAMIWFGIPLNQTYRLYKSVVGPETAYVAAKNVTCPDHLKKLYDAAMLYSDSYDGALPPASSWMTAIQDRVSDDAWLHCPDISGANGPKYGYAMNSALGGKKIGDVKDKAVVPLFYDSTSMGRDASDAVTSLPKPGRHTGKNNIVFLDGHVAQQ